MLRTLHDSDAWQRLRAPCRILCVCLLLLMQRRNANYVQFLILWQHVLSRVTQHKTWIAELPPQPCIGAFRSLVGVSNIIIRTWVFACWTCHYGSCLLGSAPDFDVWPLLRLAELCDSFRSIWKSCWCYRHHPQSMGLGMSDFPW